MIFLNLSNGFWLKEWFQDQCVYFTRFQSNHFQGVKQFDSRDYNLVFSLLLGQTCIFDGTVGNKVLADGLRQFLVAFVVFLFYFRQGGGQLMFSKKEFLSDRKKFKSFLSERVVFLSSISYSYKSQLVNSLIDYVYNIFDIKNNIKIVNKQTINQMFLDYRKYFGGDKRKQRWDSGKFNLNYKIFIFSEDYQIFLTKLKQIKDQLPRRYLLIGNVKKFPYDDKTILVINNFEEQCL